MEGTPGGLEGWDGRGEGSFGEIKVKEKKRKSKMRGRWVQHPNSNAVRHRSQARKRACRQGQGWGRMSVKRTDEERS